MSVVLCEVAGHVATITINRPDKLNAINADVLRELDVAITKASDASCRAVVLTGAGKAFVAGADIAAMKNLSEAEARAFSELGHAVFDRLEALAAPVIGAVNGFALGGGLELALACDFIYCSGKAKLGQPEVKLGVIPGFGGTQRLIRRVGIAMARELMFTGKMIRADEALRIGLANSVFAPEALIEEAQKTAATISEMGPLAIAEAKRVMRDGADRLLSEANRLESEAFGRCFATADQTEGMTAFLEKRAANFIGS